MVESDELVPAVESVEPTALAEESNEQAASFSVGDQGLSLIKEMMANGVHYGRAKRFTHFSLRPFLLTHQKGNIEIFDLKKTTEQLNQLTEVLIEIIESGQTVLFVGTQPAAQAAIKKIAQALKQPYISHKWVGGFLTNFETIRSRLVYFKDLLAKEASGEINNYPIKDAQRMRRELEKMKRLYTGVIDMTSLPNYVFIVNLDFRGHRTAVRECLAKHIPILALAGSDNDVTKAKFFITANDKAPRSINFILTTLLERIKERDYNLVSESSKPAVVNDVAEEVREESIQTDSIASENITRPAVEVDN